MKKHYIIPIFVPHLGCPNDCIFCNQRSISGQQKMITNEDVKKTIEFYLDNIKDKEAKKEVAFFGGSFTGIEEEKQEEFLKTAYEFIKAGKIDTIRISTRPDYINKKILKRLKKYKVETIELGVQSANDYILKRANRGHTFEDVKKALDDLNVNGLTVYQVMGCGIQRGYQEIVRGMEVDMQMQPKVKFEIAVSSEEWAEKTVDAIQKAAYTGEIGDGKIFTYEIRSALKIRTKETGYDAIQESE